MNRRLLAGALACAITATGAVALLAQPAMADHGAFVNGFYQDMVVDDVHRQIFISQSGPDAVVVIDFTGKVVQTLSGLAQPRDLSISPDGSTVYVAEHDTPSLGVIDTETYTVDKVELPAEHCVWSTASTGGKLWYSYRDCASETGSIGSYDPATGEITGGAVAVQAGEIQARPDRPDRLLLLDRPGRTDRAMHVYDVSGGSPVQVSAGAPGTAKGCLKAALFAGGDKVALACTSNASYQVFNTADLSAQPQTTGDPYVLTLAVSPDDRFVATTTAGFVPEGMLPAVSVWNLGENAFVTRRAEAIGYYSRENSLAFTADDKLIRVLHHAYGNRYSVEIMDQIATGATALTLSAPNFVGAMDTVRFSGSLHRGPGARTILSVQRTDSTGTHTLPSVTVDERGNFAFVDGLGRKGVGRYTVSFSGDDGHLPATKSISVNYRGLRGDVNGDGYVDVVVGAPGEDIGDDTDTGQIHLLFGSANGVTTTGNKAIHQDTANVADSNEDGDRFGNASAFGDFDGDGYSDLAVSAPGEDIGSVRDVGMVFVFRGTPSGLQPDWSTVYRPQTPVANMAYGTSLAVGDFDGDHRDDLAVGAPGVGAGSVFVYRADSQVNEYEQDEFDMPGYGDDGEQFGRALDAGDVDGDGLDDLAVGAVNDWEDSDYMGGSVTVLKGRFSGGLGTTDAQLFSKDTPGVPGASRAPDGSKGDLSDLFGYAVALADFNGDGKDDLAVGAPGSPVTGTDGKRKADAGTLTVLYSDGSRIGTAGAVELTQKSAGIPGNPGDDDRWGATITAGDSDHDGRDDLVVYGAGEDFVSVVPGTATGLTGAGAKAWDQDSPGVPGGSEAGDRWGASLRFADVKGTGHLSLILGAPGEDSGAGAFTVLYATASGLTGTGASFFSQDTAGIPGGEEKNDRFGSFF